LNSWIGVPVGPKATHIDELWILAHGEIIRRQQTAGRRILDQHVIRPLSWLGPGLSLIGDKLIIRLVRSLVGSSGPVLVLT
jgi:hypothetical protein